MTKSDPHHLSADNNKNKVKTTNQLLSLLSAFFVTTMTCASAIANQNNANTKDKQLFKRAADISPQQIEQDIATLVSFGTRHTKSLVVYPGATGAFGE